MDINQLLHDQSNDILSDAEAAIARARLAHYEKSGTEHTHQRLKALYTLTARAVKEKNLGPMVAHAETIARERFETGSTFRKFRLHLMFSRKRSGFVS